MNERTGQLLGNYRLIRLLGQGRYTEVYLGEHLYLGTQAAIKILDTDLTYNDIESFRSEARIIASIKHSHIVRILDFDVSDNTPYLVMSYVPNGTLRQRYPSGTRLSLETIIPYIKQVSEALAYAHAQKLIHRDVKPENMLVGYKDEVLLSDFGIAVLAPRSSNLVTKEAAGSIHYMAPEQFQGKPSFASDQYALGIVVYEWLCGERPFQGSFTEIATQHLFTPPPSLCEKVPMLPPIVEEVVLKALAKDPQQRFDHIKAFADALEAASISDAPVFPGPTSVLPPTTLSISDPLSITSSIVSQNEEKTVPVYQESNTAQNVSSSHSFIEKPVAPHWNFFIGKKILFVVLVLILLLGSGGLLIYNVNQAAINNAHATAQANAKNMALAATQTANIRTANVYGTATGIAGSTATANAKVNATATAGVNATAIANPDPYPPTSWQLAFYDSLKVNSGFGWSDYSPSSTARCQYINGSYYVIMSQNSGLFWCYGAINSPDFAFEVQMKIITGDCGGITFRGNNTNQQQYSLLTVCQDGSYGLYSYTSNNPVQTLLSSSSSAINVGLNQTNVIAIVANGSSLDIYINHQKINHINDSTTDCVAYSICQIGLDAISFHSATEVAYNNARAWSSYGAF